MKKTRWARILDKCRHECPQLPIHHGIYAHLERSKCRSSDVPMGVADSGGVGVGRNLWICEIHGSSCAIYGSLARAGIHGCLRNLWILRRVRSTDLTVLISTLP